MPEDNDNSTRPYADLGGWLHEMEDRLAAAEARLAELDQPAQKATVGERIRRRRRAAELTQIELAPLLGVDQSSIARWERGDRISFQRLPHIAAFLGEDVAALALEYMQTWGAAE